MNHHQKVERLRTELNKLRLLLEDLRYWAKNTERVSDMESAIESIDQTLKLTESCETC